MTENDRKIFNERFLRIWDEKITMEWETDKQKYYELMRRFFWLLWRNPEFQKDLRKVEKSTGKKYSHDSFFTSVTFKLMEMVEGGSRQDYRKSLGKLLDGEEGVGLLVRYGLLGVGFSIARWKDPAAGWNFALGKELAFLSRRARDDGWYLDTLNFWRDAEWYEWREEWRDINDSFVREMLARQFEGVGDHRLRLNLSDDDKKKRKEALLKAERWPLWRIAVEYFGRYPIEADRLVVENLRRVDPYTLKQGDPKGAIERKSLSRAEKDCRLLHAFGVLVKCVSKSNFYNTERHFLPGYRGYRLGDACATDGSPGFSKRDECYVHIRYFENFYHLSQRVEFNEEIFESVEDYGTEKKNELRNQFRQARQDYFSSDSKSAKVSSKSSFSAVVKSRLSDVKKKIQDVAPNVLQAIRDISSR